MKTKKIAVMLIAMVLLTGGLVLAADSNTSIANVMVKISCDPEILPLSPYMVGNLVLNYAVAGKAAQEALKMSPDDIYDYLSVEVLPVQGEPVQLRTSRGRSRRGREFDEDDEEEFFDERAMMEMQRFGAQKIQRNKYSKVTEARLSTKIWQSLLLRLHVDLRETKATPAAEEFMAVVVRNLSRTLERIYETHDSQLRDELAKAYHAREDAERDLHEAAGIPSETKADIATKKQLDQIVDISDLNPGMGFGDALDTLRNSVTPPLRITVMWGALVVYDIDQSSGINMDPISTAAVGTALELLLQSVSAGMMELGYVIKDGIIVVSTADKLPAPHQMLSHLEQTSLPVEVLLERKKKLIRQILDFEYDIAQLQAQRGAIEEQIALVNRQITEKLKYDPVTKELENLIMQHIAHLENLQELGKTAATDLAPVQEKLTEARIKLVERQDYDSYQAGKNQITKYRERLADSAVELAIKKAEMEVSQKQLNETENQLKAASAISPKVLRMQLATEALEQAEHRVNELKIHIGALREPTVILIGAD